MKISILAILSLFLVLTACGPNPAVPTPPPGVKETEVPSHILTPAPTQTPLPTQTPVPTKISLPTPSPNPEPIELAEFVVKMDGYGEHGNVIFADYQGPLEDLDDLYIMAWIFRNGETWEYPEAELVDERLMFEITDAAYYEGVDEIAVEIIIGSEEGLEILNKPSLVSLGIYKQFPFWSYFLPPELDIRLFMGYFPGDFTQKAPNGGNLYHNSIDIAPHTSENFLEYGIIPVYAPFEGKIIFTNPGEGDLNGGNIFVLNLMTGYIAQMGHVSKNAYSGENITTLIDHNVVSHQHLGFLAVEPEYYGPPHVHFSLIRPIPISDMDDIFAAYQDDELNQIDPTYLVLDLDTNLFFEAEQAVPSGY